MISDQELARLARLARENAYAPYSKFRVGAALLSEDGRVFTGCNIENATFGATNCAERTALFKAVSEGCRSFQKIAIAGSGRDYCSPCGICRQVLAEFSSPDLEILMCGETDYQKVTLGQLLPYTFTL